MFLKIFFHLLFLISTITTNASCRTSTSIPLSEIDRKLETYLMSILNVESLGQFQEKLMASSLMSYNETSQELVPSRAFLIDIIQSAGVFDSTELTKARNELVSNDKFSIPSNASEDYLYTVKGIQFFYQYKFPGDINYSSISGLNMDKAIAGIYHSSHTKMEQEENESFETRSFSVVALEFNNLFRNMQSALILKIPKELIISTSNSDYGALPKDIPLRAKPKVRPSLSASTVLFASNHHNEGKYFPGVSPSGETVTVTGLYISISRETFLKALEPKISKFDISPNGQYADNTFRTAFQYYWARALGLPIVFHPHLD